MTLGNSNDQPKGAAVRICPLLEQPYFEARVLMEFTVPGAKDLAESFIELSTGKELTSQAKDFFKNLGNIILRAADEAAGGQPLIKRVRR